MLPVVKYPSVVDEFLPRVEEVFTKPRLRHFAQYLTGLIVCGNKTVTGINSSFMGRNDPFSIEPLAHRRQVEWGETGQSQGEDDP